MVFSKSGARRIVRDFLNLFELFGHARFESRLKEGYLNAVERRDTAIGTFPLREQRVGISVSGHRTGVVGID